MSSGLEVAILELLITTNGRCTRSLLSAVFFGSFLLEAVTELQVFAME